jgi:hypothetical protein
MNDDGRRSRDMKRKRDHEPWTQGHLAFDMAATRIKPPDGARAEVVFVVHDNGAGNREGFRIVRGEAGLHAATLRESSSSRTFHIGREMLYEWEACSSIIHRESVHQSRKNRSRLCEGLRVE